MNSIKSAIYVSLEKRCDSIISRWMRAAHGCLLVLNVSQWRIPFMFRTVY